VPIIKLSVVIPSRNRPNLLRKCLIALNKERHLVFEIIVGNDSSLKYLEAYQGIRDEFKIKLIKGKKKGLYKNHNHLYKSAKGTHVRVMDDDHIIPSNHIFETLKFIRSDTKAIWSIGEKQPLNPKWPKKGRYPGELTSGGFSDNLKNIDDCTAIGCGSTIYPIEIFKKKIFYIERYKFGSIWLEFGVRLKMLGYKIRVMPNIFINHYYNENKRSFNDLKMNQETRIVMILFYNLIFKRNIKNIFLGLYYIIKFILFENGDNKISILLSAYKNFIDIKKSGIWNFKANSKF